MAIRTLVLMRHAQSGHPGGVRDHDRPLTDAGRAAAGLAGDWLRAHLDPVDEVLSSSALRARQTAAATATETATATAIRIEAGLYDATAQDILEVLRTTFDHVRTLLVVGHAPGIPAVAMLLAAAEGARDAVEDTADATDRDAQPADELAVRFPTAAMAVLRFQGEWSALDDGCAQLMAFRIPPA